MFDRKKYAREYGRKRRKDPVYRRHHRMYMRRYMQEFLKDPANRRKYRLTQRRWRLKNKNKPEYRKKKREYWTKWKKQNYVRYVKTRRAIEKRYRSARRTKFRKIGRDFYWSHLKTERQRKLIQYYQSLKGQKRRKYYRKHKKEILAYWKWWRKRKKALGKKP